jgi:putative inorganic carbon (HCO3(-)) transporter
MDILRRLVAVEIYPVGLCVALSVFLPRLLPLAVVVALSFWILRWIVHGRPTVRTAADPAMLVLLLLVPVTLWATAFPEMTRPQVWRLLSGIGFMYAVVNWADQRSRLQLLTYGFMVAGLLLAIVSPISVSWQGATIPFLPISLAELFPRITPFAINANIMAGQIVLLLPFPLGLLLLSSQRMHWPLLLLADASVLTMVGVLVVAQSRGALLALLAIIALVFILRWRWGWLLPLALAAVSGMIAIILGSGRVETILERGGIIKTAESRFEIWNRAWYMIQDFPFTGIGMGSFKHVANMLYPFFINPPSISHTHNLFLQVAVDLGIIGLVAWLALLGAVIHAAWRTYRHATIIGDDWLRGLGLALLGSQVALLVHGLTDVAVWVDTPTGALVWGVWGLALAAGRR